LMSWGVLVSFGIKNRGKSRVSVGKNKILDTACPANISEDKSTNKVGTNTEYETDHGNKSHGQSMVHVTGISK